MTPAETKEGTPPPSPLPFSSGQDLDFWRCGCWQKVLKENKREVKLFLPVGTLHWAPLQARSRAQGTLGEKGVGGHRGRTLGFCTLSLPAWNRFLRKQEENGSGGEEGRGDRPGGGELTQ